MNPVGDDLSELGTGLVAALGALDAHESTHDKAEGIYLMTCSTWVLLVD